MQALNTPQLRPAREDRLRAALWFAARGFGVFSVWSTDAHGVCHCPLKKGCDSPGKHPVPAIGFKAATTDPGRIEAMLAIPSDPNWGMIPPEGVFIWDVDGDEIAQFAELEQRYGVLPATLRTHTAHGLHLFLHWPSDIPRPIGKLFGFVTRWGSGSDQGYVVGPRSIHASGVEYRPDENALGIATLPEVWAQAAVGRVEPASFIEIDGEGYQLPASGFRGSRYDQILRYTASRYMRGIEREEIWAGVMNVLAPRFADTLTEPEVRSRFERAWRKTPERMGAPRSIENLPSPSVAPSLANWPAPPEAAAFRGILGSIVRAVQEGTEADPVGVLGSLLAAVGACMDNRRQLYQGSAQTPSLFVVLVGDTAAGRKGTAGSIARMVMRAAYPGWEKLIVAGLGSGEGLISYLKRNEADPAKGIIGERRALVMESEFGRLLTVMNREGSTLSPVLRDAWDGVPMGRFLAREQQLVTDHHVALTAHVTPVELRAKLNDVDAANGFGNRFLWLAVRRNRLVPFPQSPDALIGPYADELGAAIEEARNPGELHWSSEAADRWEALYERLSTTPRHGLLGALMARAEAQIARLALIYALLDRADQIEVGHLEAAEALWSFCERSMVYVFGSSTGNRHADILYDLISEGAMEWQEAKKALGLRFAVEMRDAVQLLIDRDVVEVITVPREAGGRPRRVIRLREDANGLTMQTMQTMQGPAQENGPKGPERTT